MATLLPANELPQYYPKSTSMSVEDIATYLERADAWVLGYIGGIPIFTPSLPAATVKIAVAMAFEIFTEGQEAETNPISGNITEGAPAGFYIRKAEDPLDVVRTMLLPYKTAYNAGVIVPADNGMMFLGGGR